MKLIILFWLLKLIVFGGAGTSPCTTPDCGEKEFAMKDVKFNIDFNLGEVLSRSKTKCDLPQPEPTNASLSIDCRDTFKAVDRDLVLSTTLNTDSYELTKLQMGTGDLIRCEIKEMDISEGSSGNKQIGSDIHTIPDRKPVFMSPPNSKCFSFAIRARNDAKIILKNSIHTDDQIEIVLGAHMNTNITYKVMRNTCEYKVPYPPIRILDEYYFVNYWICWRNGKAIMGSEDTMIIDENENIEIKDPIEYIGLQTSNMATGVWKILESNCPGCYDVEQAGSSAIVSCVKVKDTCL